MELCYNPQCKCTHSHTPIVLPFSFGSFCNPASTHITALSVWSNDSRIRMEEETIHNLCNSSKARFEETKYDVAHCVCMVLYCVLISRELPQGDLAQEYVYE